MNSPPHPDPQKPGSKSSWRLPLLLVLVIVAFGVLTVVPGIHMALQRAREAEEISNVTHFKYVFDSFAMDNEGVYPNEGTAEYYELPNPQSSNDFFRQLYVSGNTNSERILWSADSPVCSPTKPDDVTTTGGKFDPAQTLQPGDNHWAYFNGLANTHHPSRPFMIEPYIPGTTTFPERKIIVLRIDGSASPHPVTPAGTLLDAKGGNLLSRHSHLWSGTTPDLRQPDPAIP